MKIFLLVFSLLFFLIFKPFDEFYSLNNNLYIFSLFCILYYNLKPKAAIIYGKFNLKSFLIIYSIYFIVSNKYLLVGEIFEIRKYLIDQELLLNYNKSLYDTFKAYLQQLIVALSVFFFFKGSRWRNLGIVFLLFEVLTTGTRSYGIFIIIAILFKLSLNIKWRLKHYLISIFFLVGLFYATEYYSYVRGGYEIKEIELVSSTISFKEETKLAFELKDKSAKHFEDPFIYMATSFIPRSLWENKPMSKIVDWYTWKFWGFSSDVFQGTVLPGLVAQLYLSNSWFGLFELLVFLFGLRLLLKSVRNDPALQVLFISGIFLSLRMITLSNFLPFIIGFVLLKFKFK